HRYFEINYLSKKPLSNSTHTHFFTNSTHTYSIFFYLPTHFDYIPKPCRKLKRSPLRLCEKNEKLEETALVLMCSDCLESVHIFNLNRISFQERRYCVS